MWCDLGEPHSTDCKVHKSSPPETLTYDIWSIMLQLISLASKMESTLSRMDRATFLDVILVHSQDSHSIPAIVSLLDFALGIHFSSQHPSACLLISPQNVGADVPSFRKPP